MLRHFVLTRIGLGIQGEAWFERMTSLFEAVTFSSLANQSSSEFHWLVVIDIGAPKVARDYVEKLLASKANFHLVVTDITRMTNMRLAAHDWIYSPCQDYILQNGLLTDPFEYVITSAIDADDAWHRDFVFKVNEAFQARLPELIQQERSRGTHLRHSAGAALTFPAGIEWFVADNAARPVEYTYPSTSVSVTARFSSGISAYSSRHAPWRSCCAILDFPSIEIASDHPMWVYVRHGRTTQPWDARDLPAMSSERLSELKSIFGIDLGKVERWRSKYLSSYETAAHSGTVDLTGLQFDRIFRISALNRQIALLDCKEEFKELVEYQRDQRSQLVEALHQSGRDDFR
jgi:Putative rhamnosyl transferase